MNTPNKLELYIRNPRTSPLFFCTNSSHSRIIDKRRKPKLYKTKRYHNANLNSSPYSAGKEESRGAYVKKTWV